MHLAIRRFRSPADTKGFLSDSTALEDACGMSSPRSRVLAGLAGLLLLAGGAMVWWRNQAPDAAPVVVPPQEHRRIASNVLHSGSEETVAKVLQIEAEERQAAETFWAKEMRAQRCGAVVEKFWDAINAATNATERWHVVGDFPLEEIAIKAGNFEPVRFGIEIAAGKGPEAYVKPSEWKSFISILQKAGWELDQ